MFARSAKPRPTINMRLDSPRSTRRFSVPTTRGEPPVVRRSIPEKRSDTKIEPNRTESGPACPSDDIYAVHTPFAFRNYSSIRAFEVGTKNPDARMSDFQRKAYRGPSRFPFSDIKSNYCRHLHIVFIYSLARNSFFSKYLS